MKQSLNPPTANPKECPVDTYQGPLPSSTFVTPTEFGNGSLLPLSIPKFAGRNKATVMESIVNEIHAYSESTQISALDEMLSRLCLSQYKRGRL